MADPFSNPPLTNPITIIGPQFCAPNTIDLTMARKVSSQDGDNLSIVDVDGNILFEVKANHHSFRGRRILFEANGNPLLCMRRKILSAHWRWEVFRGNSWESKDMLFSAKKSSLIQVNKTQVDVFMAANTKEEVCDFKIKGSWVERSCTIYVGDGDSSNVMAQIHMTKTLRQENFMVTVYPNIDCAFIVALVVILNAINEDKENPVPEFEVFC